MSFRPNWPKSSQPSIHTILQVCIAFVIISVLNEVTVSVRDNSSRTLLYVYIYICVYVSVLVLGFVNNVAVLKCNV